jgi:Xaa-Pro aminopeptidase
MQFLTPSLIMKLFNKTFITAVAICLGTVTAFSQESQNTPKDYLSKEFHAGRRQALRNLMPANSVAVIFAYPEQVFSNDVNYVYHPNPDLYYFSGYTEPDAALLIFKDAQGTGDTSYNEVLFVRKRDAQREQWTGRRLGVDGAKAQLGFKKFIMAASLPNSLSTLRNLQPLYTTTCLTMPVAILKD